MLDKNVCLCGGGYPGNQWPDSLLVPWALQRSLLFHLGCIRKYWHSGTRPGLSVVAKRVAAEKNQSTAVD
ncbi:hypothetical protein [Erwinia tracheiphila]|nr:hypothetical protein [Erwinia tracheiphila]